MSKNKEALKQLLKKLTAIDAGAGMEQPVIRCILEEITPHVDEVFVDSRGNLIARKEGATPGQRLMLAAHTDQIGMIVKNILPNGFLLFEKNGAVPNNLLIGRKVSVGEGGIPGVVGAKPGHLQTPEEASKVARPEQCYVDLGVDSRAQVEALGIDIGDQIIWQSDFMEMANPDRVCTKAVDDRIGCAILIQLMRTLSREDFSGTLCAVFTVLEEVGLHGVPAAAARVQPDYAVALDTIPAGDTPDIQTELSLPIYLGKGPGFPIADGVMNVFYHHIHPAVRRIIQATAKAQNIHLQKCTILGGMYTTDASKLAYAGEGIPTAVLAVPRRYSHSPIELMDLNDAADVLAILVGMAKQNREQNLSFL